MQGGVTEMQGVYQMGEDSTNHFRIGSVEAQVCNYYFVIILISLINSKPCFSEQARIMLEWVLDY